MMKDRLNRPKRMHRIALAMLATTLMVTACTGGNRSFDYPEPPVRRGSF